jgi:tetratricopeptide (TPR) repeat protein
MGREGFDFYDDAVEPRPGVALGGVARPGSATLGAVEPWLREVAGGGPFFLFFHLFEPHAPYEPPEPFASRFADPYDGEVAAADAVVGELLALLEGLGVYDGALVILLSDHGEGLGDHGEEQHGIFLYREAIQVPLIVKLPGGGRAGTRVASPAQLVDVVPTVLDVLGVPVPAELPGASLLALPEAERPIYAETFYPRLHFGWSELTSLVSGRHHFIDAPTPELYDLEADPAESLDLLRQERRTAAELRRRLEGFERPLEAPGAVDPETRARLAALGYLGGPADAGDGPLPDPKERVHVLGELRAAAELVERGELGAAVERYRGALADSPGMVDGWQALGDLLRRLGRVGEARDAYRHAFEAAGGDPHLGLGLALLEMELGHFDDARTLIDAAADAGVEVGPARRRLGLALARSGRFGEAVTVLDPLARGGDPEAAAALGRVLSEAGRQEEAEAVLRRAVDEDPENAAAWEHLGLVHLRQERWADARDASRRAVELDSGRAEAWNNLGVARHQTGDPVAALEAWERAASLAPDPWDTLFNLGTRAADLGRPDQARAALRRFVDGAPANRYPRELQQARLLLRRLGG